MRILECLRKEQPPPEWPRSKRGWRPNAQTLALGFACSEKTISRDLKSLRAAGYEIDYDKAAFRYIWTNKAAMEPLPLMTATEEEILALLTALALSGTVLDSGTAKRLDSFLSKLEQHLPDGYTHPLETVAATLSYRHSQKSLEDSQTWTLLQRAIIDEKGVRLSYHSPFEENQLRKVKLLPLHLAWLQGTWYLYALKHPAPEQIRPEDIHLYRLSRMTDIRPATWRVPADWNRTLLHKRIRQGLGPWQGDELHTVRLRIDEAIAGFLMEQDWPDGHAFEQEEGGSWILTFPTTAPERINHLVLQWVSGIELLEPAWLRRGIANSAEAVRDKHQ